MAGAGFKDFQAGEVLTAVDVDTYLMQQTIMVFAGTAARGSQSGHRRKACSLICKTPTL